MNVNPLPDFVETQSIPAAHKGSALLISLILLFMLSLMGLSSMRSSVLETRMASNSIQTASTFQNAESINELAINDPENFEDALAIADIEEVRAGIIDDSTKINAKYDLLVSDELENSTSVQYVGISPAYGFSSGKDGFVGYTFVIESEVRVDSVRVRSGVTQGAYRIAPAP